MIFLRTPPCWIHLTHAPPSPRQSPVLSGDAPEDPASAEVVSAPSAELEDDSKDPTSAKVVSYPSAEAAPETPPQPRPPLVPQSQYLMLQLPSLGTSDMNSLNESELTKDNEE